MTEVGKRKVHSAEFKAKAGMEAVRGTKTLNEIGQQYGVHPVVGSQLKKEILERAATLFVGKRGPKPADRRGIHSPPVLWQSPHGGVSAARWLSGQP